jgi:hypothetical protein
MILARGARTNRAPETRKQTCLARQARSRPCGATAFNKGDVKTMVALFDESGSILDGLPPHVWHGPTACQNWYREALEAGEREGAADYSIAIGEPHHADVTGDNAYVVAPATMHSKCMASRLRSPARPRRSRCAGSRQGGAFEPGHGLRVRKLRMRQGKSRSQYARA